MIKTHCLVPETIKICALIKELASTKCTEKVTVKVSQQSFFNSKISVLLSFKFLTLP